MEEHVREVKNEANQPRGRRDTFQIILYKAILQRILKQCNFSPSTRHISPLPLLFPATSRLLNHTADNFGREDEGLCQDSEEQVQVKAVLLQAPSEGLPACAVGAGSREHRDVSPTQTHLHRHLLFFLYLYLYPSKCLLLQANYHALTILGTLTHSDGLKGQLCTRD